MVKAIWNGQVLAESNNTVFVDRKHYFPIEDVKKEFLEESHTHTVCAWKGEASYYSVIVNGQKNKDAAWYYPYPKEKAKQIKSRVAFSYVHGVDVVEE
jgi:uncharacterized protein (DUF427 family)